MEEIKEIVYVKTDKDGVITAIDSSAGNKPRRGRQACNYTARPRQ